MAQTKKKAARRTASAPAGALPRGSRTLGSSTKAQALATARAVPTGSVALAFAQPIGLASRTQALDADVSGEIAGLAPTFGDVLSSIGQGVAASQTALDQGLIETARQLSDTKIRVISEVIQKLDDDGLPVASQTELIQNDVSVIQFVSPTVHEWRHVALAMDLEVGAFDSERGMKFKKKQSSDRAANVGLFFGFLGVGFLSMSESRASGSSQREDELDWASGQLRLDAELAPRRTEKFPEATQVVIGPRIFISQGSVVETVAAGVVTARAIDLLIKVLKADGSENPNQNLTVDADGLQVSFATNSTTDADGEVTCTVTRSVPNARFSTPQRRRVTVQLGEIKQSVDLVL